MKELLERLKNMSLRTRWTLGGGAAVVLLVTVWLGWWATRPVYTDLYQDLSDQDMGQITASLDKWHIPFRYGQVAGSVEVPESTVADARMRLATDGVPSHGTVGFEIFDNADYGMTEFAQKVNYQRAIQGELERTIMSLREVKFARVHITMKQSDLFLKDEQEPKASVTMSMREGAQLSPAQIGGIQNLVAAAVQGLEPKAVIVVDDRGEALAGPSQDLQAGGGVDGRLQEQARIEQDIRKKIVGMLSGALGLKDPAVSVSVVLNFDHVKRTEQKVLTAPDGSGYMVHRQETSTEPPSDAAAEPKPSPKKNVISSTVDYEDGKSYEETEFAQGRVQRITVGVVVPAGLPSDQQQRLREAISAAAGLDPTRGDEVQLVAAVAEQPGAAWDKRTTPSQAVASPAGKASIPAAGQPAIQVKWLLAGGILLVGLVLLALGLPRRRKPIEPIRLEAVLAEIRAWLGE